MKQIFYCTLLLFTLLALLTACVPIQPAAKMHKSESQDSSIQHGNDHSILTVDASLNESTHGSYRTIQEALDHAMHDEMHDGQTVTIQVKPGTYLGPILIERPNTKLVALSEAQYDADGYLTGFAHPVTITIDRDLATAEMVVEIGASNVTVSGFVVDSGSFKSDDFNVGIGATLVAADVHLKDIEISDNEIKNIADTASLLYQASGKVLRNRIETAGFLGFNGSGSAVDGEAELWIEKNWVANKELGICTISSVADTRGRALNLGPASVNVHLIGNHVSDSKPFFNATPGHGLYFFAKLASPSANPASEATLHGEIVGNRVVNSGGAAIAIKAGNAQDQASKFMTDLTMHDNQFEGNAEIAHFVFEAMDAGFAHNSTIKVADVDGVIPAAEVKAAELGPVENGNRLGVTH